MAVSQDISNRVFLAVAEPLRNALDSLSGVRMVDWLAGKVAPQSSEAENALGMAFAFTHIRNMAQQDEAVTISAFHDIMGIPGRWGKPAYQEKIFDRLLLGAIGSTLTSQLTYHLRVHASTALAELLDRNMAPGGDIVQAVRTLDRYEGLSVGEFSLSPAVVEARYVRLDKFFPELPMDIKADILGVTKCGQGRRDKYAGMFFDDLRPSLDSGSDENRRDACVYTLWAIRNVGYGDIESQELMKGTGRRSDMLRKVLDTVAQLPPDLRDSVLRHANNGYLRLSSVMKDFRDSFFDASGSATPAAVLVTPGAQPGSAASPLPQ